MNADQVAVVECGVLHDAGVLRQVPCRRPKGHRPFSVDGIGHMSDPATFGLVVAEQVAVTDWGLRCSESGQVIPQLDRETAEREVRNTPNHDDTVVCRQRVPEVVTEWTEPPADHINLPEQETTQ